MNPNYEILEQVLRLDIEAGLATAAQRNAQRQLTELNKKSKEIEERISKLRNDMRLKEGDMLRKYRRLDELEESKSEKSARLFAAKNDEEHRGIKREVDNIDKEARDTQRHCSENEEHIERAKDLLRREEEDLNRTLSASAEERQKAEDAAQESAGRLAELATARDQFTGRMDDRLTSHYRRVANVTRNPNGPICRITNNACGNCHMNIPPQLMNSIRSGREVEFCPNCHHVLLPNNQASV